MSLVCEICTEKQFKYKCPNCAIKYCSVICFKKHKETGCTKTTEKPEKALDIVKTESGVLENNENINKSEVSSTILQSEVPISVLKAKEKEPSSQYKYVTQEQLSKIETSPEMIEILKDSRLQNSILQIENAEDKFKALEDAMKDPDFAKFLNLLSNTIQT